MFSHIMVGSNDLDRSKRFYDAVFEAIGGRAGRRDDVVLSYHHQGSVFMVRTPLDNARATHGNGSTIGFSLASPEQVHSWHDAGVAAGGTAVEDPPGTRSLTFGSYYLAYLRDPDGNKLCALHSLSED
jgi:catechol 2,3-dioxygenase-like lactoylglutathione lyase family enzyme